MDLSKCNVGMAITGSFCTFDKIKTAENRGISVAYCSADYGYGVSGKQLYSLYAYAVGGGSKSTLYCDQPHKYG